MEIQVQKAGRGKPRNPPRTVHAYDRETGAHMSEHPSVHEVVNKFSIPLKSLENCLAGSTKGLHRSWRGLIFSFDPEFVVPGRKTKLGIPVEVQVYPSQEWTRYDSIEKAAMAVGCSDVSICRSLKKQEEKPEEFFPVKRRYFVRMYTGEVKP